MFRKSNDSEMLTFVVAVSTLGTVLALPTSPVYETVYAENFGLHASNHTDVNGVLYRTHGNRSRVASANLYFTNVVAPDQELYKTFLRASAVELSLSLPKTGGDFRLILKFVPSCPTADCSFNITLNRKHRVLSNFNVYQTVQVLNKGFDHVIDFSVCSDGRLWYRGETSMLSDCAINVLVQSERAVQMSAVSLFRRATPGSKVCQTKVASTTLVTPSSTRATKVYPKKTSTQWPVANWSNPDRNRIHFQFDLPKWFRRLQERNLR